MRHLLGLLIGGVFLLLAGGFYSSADSVRYREPFGYGASGFGLVMLAAALGVLVVLLLRLLIAWRRLGAQADDAEPVGPAHPGPQRGGLLLRTCGWAGAFLVSIGILRGWDWPLMLLGAILLAFAGRATYQLARPQPPAS
jgi:hypothetical protein